MNKQAIYTIMGIVFSLMIAFCGWVVTNTLLDRQESILLAGSTNNTSAVETIPGTDNESKNLYPTTKPVISQVEMAKILANWNAPRKSIQPHDPVDGQLSMEQAINAAGTGLSDFAKQGIISPELLEGQFTLIHASLCENLPVIKKNQTIIRELPPEYSYWTIMFDNKKVNVRLTINAVTGAIWRADIISYQEGTTLTDLNWEELLDKYVVYLGLEGGQSLELGENWASKEFAGDTIRVIAVKNEGEAAGVRSNNETSLHIFALASQRDQYLVVNKQIDDTGS
ncbi:MAG: hypothetical protein ACM3MK_00870 [Chitinophagales bacterium]